MALSGAALAFKNLLLLRAGREQLMVVSTRSEDPGQIH